MHSIKYQIFSNWLLSCHVAQQFHVQCGLANCLTLETCQCSSHSQYLLHGKLNPGLTVLTFLLDGMFMLLCGKSSKQTKRIIMTTAKTLYGFLPLNDKTEEKYPIDLEKPEPYLGFTLSLLCIKNLSTTPWTNHSSLGTQNLRVPRIHWGLYKGCS